MIVNALIIGCGNIGSQYDLKNNFVQTHSKSMFTSNWINNVDLFDLDQSDIERAKLLKQTIPQIDRVECVSMQKYSSDKKYNLIVLRWCSGYLADDELVHQLKVWKGWLDRGKDAHSDA